MNDSRKNTRYRVAVIGFAVGIVCAAGWVLLGARKPTDAISSAPRDRFDPTIANPSLDPESVVRMQVMSLMEAAEDPDRLIVCYSLASPNNRSQTGPFTRFATLFTNPIYQPLIGCQSVLVGRASIDDRFAIVMATIISADDRTMTYQFELSRQGLADSRSDGESVESSDKIESRDDFAGCWMTDAVTPIFLVVGQPVPQSPESISERDGA